MYTTPYVQYVYTNSKEIKIFNFKTDGSMKIITIDFFLQHNMFQLNVPIDHFQ